jgi:tripartite-type tricarboxylate transporter receptor subunit TctC
MRLAKIIVALASVASALTASAAFAQAYPSKPIKLIIPFAPGGTTDIVARIMAAKMTPLMGRTRRLHDRHGLGLHHGHQYRCL